jgi:phage gpG-like protein
MPLTNNPFSSKTQALRSRLLTLPVKIGDTAVLFAKQRFAQRNWIGNTTEAWRQRKAQTKWSKTKRNKGRALLVDTGRLRRSIRIMARSSTSVTIGSDVPYAIAHNDGYRGTVTQQVGAHTRRQFGKEKRGTGIYSVKTQKEKQRTYKVVSGTIDVKAHARTITQNIPRRRFIGQSPYLDKQVQRIISAEIMKALK